MQTSDTSLTGGFQNPVFDAQTVFRVLMNCMARPGTIGTVSPQAVPPAPLGLAAGALMLTLCDHDTPVWLTPQLSTPNVTGWLAFHCGASITREKKDARFAFAQAKAVLPSLSAFSLGSHEYPDRSTTLFIEIEALDGGAPLILTGPGIKGSTDIAPHGLPEQFLRQWAENGAAFPQGVDVVLTAGRQLAALPRTCKIAQKGA